MPTHSALRARTSGTAGRLIALVTDAVVLIIVLWIVMWMLDANTGNAVVAFFHDAATWLTAWCHDIFTVDPEWLRVLLSYGLPALLYLVVGHALARRL
ncbi:hypothetical protein ACN20G_18915 [Streptomyces sp. BI20]|uniref:hypothetical protein n=1 Tax=Streptomyces sp. BI20 TaxID=3403460 RepID=UPI003C708982